MSEAQSAISWYVYVLQCADSSYYTGITTDLVRRLEEHNEGALGARYTRARRPVEMVYSESAENRAEATRREIAIKKLTRKQKVELIGATTE